MGRDSRRPASVTLRSRSQFRQQLSGADGSYSFDDVPPGDYELVSALPHFVQTPEYRSITILPGGCAHRLLELKPETRLSGVAVHRDGSPAANIEVQLLRRTPQGEWADEAAHARTTDSAGEFVFENVPATEYLVGIDRERNGPDSPGSRTVQLLPGMPIDGLRLPLPDPGPQRSIIIRVTWPNGRAPGPDELQIFANQRLVHSGAGEAFEYSFAGVANRRYDMRAQYWFQDRPGAAPEGGPRFAPSSTVTIEPGSAPVTVHLILAPTQ